ncbi:HNH endonuclease, partial [Xanthomonas citri pv. citri]|nr:HNH endonuclease [Xanthomonas citri pv. citri]
GEHGAGYIEVHHRVPLHVSGTVMTSLEDLALLCSNCHRMIHRRRPWLTVEQLNELVGPGVS